MTQRTEYQPSPIEQATRRVLEKISEATSTAFHEFGLDQPTTAQRITEANFRRMLALYFHDRTITDWQSDLGIPLDRPPDRDTP